MKHLIFNVDFRFSRRNFDDDNASFYRNLISLGLLVTDEGHGRFSWFRPISPRPVACGQVFEIGVEMAFYKPAMRL